VSSLETELSELKQTNQFAEALSSIPGIVDNYLASQMKDAVNVAVQLKSNKLREDTQAENDEFLKHIDSNIKAIIKDQVKAQTSYAATTTLSKFKLKKIFIDKIEENKSLNGSEIQKNLYNTLIESYNSDKDLFVSYGDMVTLKRGRDDQDKDKEPSAGANRGTTRRRSGTKESSKEATQKESKSISSSKGTQSLFNEFLATPIDFSAFIMNRLKLNNLTQDVLTGPIYDLMKGTCKSVVELEYHMEEVFKATNDQLDWHNPKGRPYPHDLSKPLPLIQNARGRQVIPFDHFINNDLEYLKGRSLSKKYTTSLTKTKGPKRHRFYGYATNMETSKDVYSRHMIIDVTSLKIMEFFGYKHLEEITVRRQDDQLYRYRYSNQMIQPEQEGSTQGYPLDSVEVLRFDTSAGNPVKEIILKLNLPDHRILKDRDKDTEHLSQSDEVLKLKNFKKDATLKLFKSTNQERYKHVSPEVTSSQDGKVYKMAKRDYAWLMISRDITSLDARHSMSAARHGARSSSLPSDRAFSRPAGHSSQAVLAHLTFSGCLLLLLVFLYSS
ncbi:hypothetical protein Tco_1070653, partial [Tanacetum coccineum]